MDWLVFGSRPECSGLLPCWIDVTPFIIILVWEKYLCGDIINTSLFHFRQHDFILYQILGL